MADGRYSLDDILNEYSSSGKKPSDSDIALDELIGSYQKKDTSLLHNNLSASELPEMPTDKIVEADYGNTHETGGGSVKTALKEAVHKNIELPSEKQSKQENEFENKYRRLSQADDKKYIPDEELPPPVKVKKTVPSFSESFEDSAVVSDEEYRPLIRKAPPKIINDAHEKTNPFSFLLKKDGEAEKENELDNDLSYAEMYRYHTGTIKDPFEKYSSKDNIDINSILNEYTSSHISKPSNTDTSHIKGFTDIFSRLNKKSDASVGNTELLDGMMKIKKERVHKTSLIPPVSRKSISDIDLKLDDKILPNTAQIPVNEEQAEIEKFNALKERRNKKVKDFVFIGDEEENENEEEESDIQAEAGVIDDFEKLEDAPSISNDIAQLKRSLSLRLFVLIICLLLSGYVALANDFRGIPKPEFISKITDTTVFLFINSIIGIAAAFMSYTVLSCGLSKLFTFKADCDSITAVAVVSSIGSSMIFLACTNLVRDSFVHDYVPVAVAALLFNTIGKLLIVNRTQRNFKYVSGDSEKYAVVMVQDEETAQTFTRGALNDFPTLATTRKTEFISGFLKTSYSSDNTDKFSRFVSPIVLCISLLIAVLAGFITKSDFGTKSVFIGISVFTGCVSICSAFSLMLVVNLPMDKASKKYREIDGAMLGYDSIEEFGDTNSVLIDATQIFPKGSVKLSAIKIFSDTRIDEAIVEAASLTSQSNSILKNMFYDIIAGKTEMLNPVESYIFEDSIGLCGWINNKRVLLGSRELMINHSIEGMPTEAKEKEYTENGKTAIYLSISGELSAMFVVELTTTLEVQQALKDMEKNGIYVMIRTVDSAISINKLSDMFDVSPEMFKLIPFRNHETFEEVTSYQPTQSATLACTGRFAAFSALILGAKRLRTTINAGICIQAVSILLGIIITAALVIFRAFGELSVSVIIAYNLIFTFVLVAFQSFRKC